MKLNNFIIRNNFLQLFYENGKTQIITLTKNSGRIIWRQIYSGYAKHTGVLVGRDSYTGEQIVIHTHSDSGKPEATTMANFSRGKSCFFENIKCVNSKIRTLEIGLQAVIDSTPYSLLFNNCQMLTSNACNNVKRSRDVEKTILLGIVATAAVGGAIYLNSNSKK